MIKPKSVWTNHVAWILEEEMMVYVWQITYGHSLRHLLQQEVNWISPSLQAGLSFDLLWPVEWRSHTAQTAEPKLQEALQSMCLPP